MQQAVQIGYSATREYAPERSAQRTVEVPERPMRASGVELGGELQATGFREQQWLIERNGRFLQTSELLYRLLENADGQRTLEDIAGAVSAATEWAVSVEDVRKLLGTSLIPRGLVLPPGQPQARARSEVAAPGAQASPRSPLRLNMRARAFGPNVIDPVARMLQVLYAGPILVTMLIASLVAHWWVYVEHGLARALVDALTTPGALLIITAAVLVSGAFHEFGHAAAHALSNGSVVCCG